jgi:hypothetical protein
MSDSRIGCEGIKSKLRHQDLGTRQLVSHSAAEAFGNVLASYSHLNSQPGRIYYL